MNRNRLSNIPTMKKDYIGAIYQSNNFGAVRILKEVEKVGKHRRFLVEFLNTGRQKEADIGSIRTGRLKDDVNYIGAIYQSNNFGPIRIIKEAPKRSPKSRYFLIEFLNTGQKKEVDLAAIKRGNVKDLTAPTVFSVGAVGMQFAATNHKKEYSLWSSIIERCYYKKNKCFKNYGGDGVRVCDRWHFFPNFLEDIKDLKGYDNWVKGDKYHLDKDILCEGKGRLYSKENCQFVHESINVAERTERLRKEKKT